jgi:hypothetical protein
MNINKHDKYIERKKNESGTSLSHLMLRIAERTRKGTKERQVTCCQNIISLRFRKLNFVQLMDVQHTYLDLEVILQPSFTDLVHYTKTTESTISKTT